MEKILKLFIYNGEGAEDVLFPNADNPIEIGTFRYDAKRMGGAPIITASVNYPSCLDDEWTNNVYAEFNGEKYFLKQTPTSSYDNQDEMYKHDIELVSERIALDNVYFFDVVTGNPSDNDKPVSNSTKVVFFGGIREFASRLQDSLEYSGLDYTVVVDDGIETEEKLMSFEDQFFSNVLQEIYKTYDIPYYFSGKTIHVGYSEDVYPSTFSYGVDDALISITKNNANYKVVNRVTGTGSTDNIPFYYPNNSPKGDLELESHTSCKIEIANLNTFANKVNLDESITYSKASAGSLYSYTYKVGGATTPTAFSGSPIQIPMGANNSNTLHLSFTFTVSGNGSFEIGGKFKVDNSAEYNYSSFLKSANLSNRYGTKSLEIREGKVICQDLDNGSHTINLHFLMPYLGRTRYSVTPSTIVTPSGVWKNDNGDEVKLEEIGLKIISGSPSSGDYIVQRLSRYINTSQKLLPYKYRETLGKERFYNAENGVYEGHVFNNPFVEGKPIEHIISAEDIKPSIKGMMYDGNRIDMFCDFAFDENDNDETYEDKDGNVFFKHPYFFAKLKPLGFNLFDHAIEQQPMTISFTSGHSGSCNFEIGVTEGYPQKNPVQINEDGTLKRDDEGDVICGVKQKVTQYQDSQQDTTNNSVWIALKKEEETYGILMPTKETRPTINDTFVILGIHLPQEYIISAEKKLEDAIIKYLKENNDEKFTFSVRFSRIYFAENPDVLKYLNENSRINIEYNNKIYTLYVSSFSYNMASGDALPDISVELSDTLTVTQNALQNAINEVKGEVSSNIANIDVLALASPYFIRKNIKDETNAIVNFKKGAQFGSGGKVDVYSDGDAKLTIDYLEVKKKATFTSLEIQEKTHVGGQIIISPASMTCNKVEKDEERNIYRCYFTSEDEEGNAVFNQFAIDDLAICQTFNAVGSHYYWRRVIGIGEDFIELSNEEGDYDEGSDEPMVGDKIVQLGNLNDPSRQAAQVLSSHGDNAPAFIMYNGINSFSLRDKEVTGVLWNPSKKEPQMFSYGDFFFGDGSTDDDENLTGQFITYQKKKGDTKKKLHINADVTFGADSKGLSNLSEWQQAEQDIEDANNKAKEALNSAQEALLNMSWLGEDITAINKRLDGVVENYFYEGSPTMQNRPASEWIAEDSSNVLINHLGDTYTNINEYRDDSDNVIDEDAGKSWRWCKCDEQTIETRSSGTYNLASSSWTKVGSIPVLNYGSFRIVINGESRTHGTFTGYDKEMRVSSGPPTYVKVDSAGNVYVLDENRFIQGYITILFYIGAVIGQDYNTGQDVFFHWHPIADSDAVKALLEASKAQTTADGKSTTYLSKPTNGYKEGDIWILEQEYTLNGVNYTKGELVVAKQTSSLFDASHWEKKVKYTDDSALEGFIDGDFKKYKEQVDKKIDTYYEGSDPSENWNTADDKAAHKGDLWYTGGESKVWTGSEWELIEGVPSDLYDTLDKKKQVFTSEPTPPYYQGDLWAQGNTGDLMVCTKSRESGTYSSSEWEKASKYTDDTSLNTFITGEFASLKTQVDGKIDTWYQESDPSTAWTTSTDKAAHKGDLWYKDGKNYIYNGAAWEFIEGVPQSLYDNVDRKKQVFYEQPTTPYEVGDLWAQGEGGDIMICKSSKVSGGFDSSDWVKAANYTDGSNTKNLIPDSRVIKSFRLPREHYPTGKSSLYYAKIFLPIRVNAGETYTFKCEKSKILSGSQTGYRIRIDDGTKGEAGVTNVYSTWGSLSIGDKKYTTITILDGVINKVAYLSIVRQGTSGNSESDSIVLNNVSLVRGNTPMPVWEDYQGDVGLKNLIDRHPSDAATIVGNTQYSNWDFAHLTVNGGESYTFMAESALATNDTGFNIGLYDSSNNKWVNEETWPIYIKNGSYVYGTLNVANTIVTKSPDEQTTISVPAFNNTSLYHIGTIELKDGREYSSIYYRKNDGQTKDVNFALDTDIQIVGGPPTYIRIESATGNVYILDQYGYHAQVGLALTFTYTDSTTETVKDKDVRLLVYAGQTPTNGKTLTINNFSLVKGTTPLMVWKENTDYLTNAFKSGATTVEGGLVMTQAVMVEDGSGNVKGMLNGSDFAKDGEHGKIILAGGIPSTNANGSTALESRAKEATTIIYEDGTIDTQKLIATNAEINGKITAEEGAIGPFSINYWKLTSVQNGDEYIDNSTYKRTDTIELSSAFLGVKAEIKNSSGTRVGYSQCTLYPSANAMSANYAAIIRNSAVPHAAATAPFYYEEQPCIALIVGAEGANNINKEGYGGNFAMQVENGMIAGFRPQSRVITSTGTCKLTKYDHTVVFNVSSGSVYVYLPDDPIEGQEYDLYTCHATMDIYIYPGNKGMYNFIDAANIAAGSNDPFTTNYRRHIHIFYAGGQWWENYRYLQK